MDEIKIWDLQQLPGFEAIEEPDEIEEKEPEEAEEDPEDENTEYRISFKDLNKIIGYDKFTKEGVTKSKRKDLDIFIKKDDFLNQNKYEIKIDDPNTKLLKVVEKPIILIYDEKEIDKNLLNKESSDLLKFNGLELPCEYKDKSLRELNKALKESQKISSQLKDKIKNVAKYDHFEGKNIAYPKIKIQIKLH